MFLPEDLSFFVDIERLYNEITNLGVNLKREVDERPLLVDKLTIKGALEIGFEILYRVKES